jgi:chitinase
MNDKQNYLLTIAAGAFPGYIRNTEMSEVSDTVDWVNLMTYDFHGDWDDVSGHHAPLYDEAGEASTGMLSVNDTVKAFMDAGIPARKLVMGIPFYGRSWTECGVTNNGLGQACGKGAKGVIADGIHEYGNLEKQGWLNGNGFVRYWSDNAKVPWLYKKSTGTFVTYEDPESIRYKTDYVKAKGLGGAMLWELSQDPNRTLLNAVFKGLQSSTSS